MRSSKSADANPKELVPLSPEAPRVCREDVALSRQPNGVKSNPITKAGPGIQSHSESEIENCDLFWATDDLSGRTVRILKVPPKMDENDLRAGLSDLVDSRR